ncbi:MAG: hypothetical protein ACJAV9_001287, partial [Urechidicola sp.]
LRYILEEQWPGIGNVFLSNAIDLLKNDYNRSSSLLMGFYKV